jgi:hypothetical protein
MPRLFKTFLLWLLIAALPVQGMAAVAKASCGPERHMSMATTVVMAHLHAEDGAMMDHHHADQAMEGHLHATDESDADASGSGTDSASQNTHKSAYCSACAACCFGATAPPSSLSWKPVLGSHLAEALPALVQSTGHIPSRIERPPRHLSA